MKFSKLKPLWRHVFLKILKELRNFNPTKKTQSTIQNAVFQNKLTFIILNQNLQTSHKLLPCLEKCTIKPTYFLFCLKETTNKPLKVAGTKSLFFSVYVTGTTCFYVFIPCDQWKTLFFIKVCNLTF